MIDASSGTDRTINVNLHSVGRLLSIFGAAPVSCNCGAAYLSGLGFAPNMGEVIRYQAVIRLTLCVIDIAYCVYLIPPPLNGTASSAEYLNRFSGRSLTLGILRHAVGATARLMRRGVAYKAPPQDDALSGIYRTSLEPRGGNEPPRPRRRSHGYGPAFCYSTRHIF